MVILFVIFEGLPWCFPPSGCTFMRSTFLSATCRVFFFISLSALIISSFLLPFCLFSSFLLNTSPYGCGVVGSFLIGGGLLYNAVLVLLYNCLESAISIHMFYSLLRPALYPPAYLTFRSSQSTRLGSLALQLLPLASYLQWQSVYF